MRHGQESSELNRGCPLGIKKKARGQWITPTRGSGLWPGKKLLVPSRKIPYRSMDEFVLAGQGTGRIEEGDQGSAKN